MKILHIMNNEKFISSYVEFINKNFKMKEHYFLIIDGLSEEKMPIPKYLNVEYLKTFKKKDRILKVFESIISLYWILLKRILKYEKIYFHSLFDKRIILFLYIFRTFLKKSYWLMWGGDLYCYRNRKNKFIYKIWYKIENYVKKNIKGYVTHIKGDYKLAQKWYDAKGKYYNCFIYPSNLYKDIYMKENKKEDIYIQIGNSADPSNNHLEIFDKLKSYKDKNIKIFCILSYGNMEYAKDVILKGKKIFGNKFVPIVDFMKFDQYMEFLSKIDIAIFAHNRQQAVGNITSLLSMKKTVYLKEKVTTYDMLKDLGVKVKSFDKFEDLEKFNDEILEKNKEIIKERFSEKRLKEDLNIIFNS